MSTALVQPRTPRRASAAERAAIDREHREILVALDVLIPPANQSDIQQQHGGVVQLHEVATVAGLESPQAKGREASAVCVQPDAAYSRAAAISSADPTSAGQRNAAVAPPCPDLPAGIVLPAPPGVYARFFAHGVLCQARPNHPHQVKPCLTI